jgi:uracil-DNA glycosylase
MVKLGNEWDALLKPHFESQSYQNLRKFLKYEYSHYTVYPPMDEIFSALKTTSYSDVRVVLLGQDPYHGPGQAHGMCFSVRPGVAPPPSLVNIFTELKDDMGIPTPKSGCLIKWAQNGVLLLNTVLTVRRGAPGSHRGHGWEQLTDCIIQLLGKREQPTVFLLWGAFARAKAPLITGKNHLVLQCAHPSPFSASNGFFGCRHFSKAKAFLNANGYDIDWSL